MSPRARVAFGALVLAPFLACTLGAGSFAGKTCDTQADCPEPYVCTQVRQGGATCELLHGLDTNLGGDGGTGGGAGGGGGTVLVDWCHDVSPIMMGNCISNCHGNDHTGAPGQMFRLDFYKFDGGQGAYDMRASIVVQVQNDIMPPVGITPRPTMAQRTTILNWVNEGAAECLDGGP